jgi:hypothetical protein
VRSGITAARKRGVVFGRRPGQRIKADRFAPKVLKLVSDGQSYREINHRLGLSKNTVLDIVKRDHAAWPTMTIARLVGLTPALRASAMSAMVSVTGHSITQSAKTWQPTHWIEVSLEIFGLCTANRLGSNDA